jgi:hypothetical protein
MVNYMMLVRRVLEGLFNNSGETRAHDQST